MGYLNKLTGQVDYDNVNHNSRGSALTITIPQYGTVFFIEKDVDNHYVMRTQLNNTSAPQSISIPNGAYYCFAQGTSAGGLFGQVQLRNGATIYVQDSSGADTARTSVHLGPAELWEFKIVDRINEVTQ